MGIRIKEGKTTKKGRITLSLELNYFSKTWSEPLKVFKYKSPKNAEEREHNRRKQLFAEGVRIQKMTEYENEGDNSINRFRKNESFVKYFKELTNKKSGVEGNYATWEATYQHLLCFVDGQDIRFRDCTDIFLNKFRDHLLTVNSRKSDTKLSQNSAHVYLSKIKAALNQARKDRIIAENLTIGIDKIKRKETEREFLHENELNKVSTSHCACPLLKRAFLFSCLTGLRWSDVSKLKWKEIQYSEQEKMWKLNYIQKKTGLRHYHPIQKQVIDLLGTFGDPEKQVFQGLQYSAKNNRILIKWFKAAGIHKHLTFHCARHTYAIIMLIATKDLYLVSTLLGHKDIKTTQIYAKIVNETKNVGVDSFPNISIAV
jgi:integrase